MNAYDTHDIVFDTIKKGILADIEKPASLISSNIVSADDANIASFPRVVLQELLLLTRGKSLDYQNKDRVITWQVDIYCNGLAAETDCRTLAKIIERQFDEFRFDNMGGGNLKVVDTLTRRLTIRFRGLFREDTNKFY